MNEETRETIETFAAKFPQIGPAVQDLLQEFEGDAEALSLYDFSTRVLLPEILLPLLTYRRAHDPELTKFFEIVEDLYKRPSDYLSGWLAVEICESLWTNEARALNYMGPATKADYEATLARYAAASRRALDPPA
jgi:hypothetical protein